MFSTIEKYDAQSWHNSLNIPNLNLKHLKTIDSQNHHTIFTKKVLKKQKPKNIVDYLKIHSNHQKDDGNNKGKLRKTYTEKGEFSVYNSY